MNYQQRKIKFRVFFFDGEDYSSGEMISAQEVYRENYIEFDDWGELVATDEDSDNPCSIIMQFTGLQDKNGKEIYEGDILKYDMPDYDEKTYQDILIEYVEEVQFNNGCFELDGCPLYIGNTVGEVIGNIYENSELIKT